MTTETKPTKIYLACPYSAPEFSLRELRARIASRVAAFFMSRGHVVFSPITHGHEIAEFLPPALAYDHDFWMAQCLPMLESCDVLVVVPLYGWERSRGVAAERAVAKDLCLAEVFWSLNSPTALLTDYRGRALADQSLLTPTTHSIEA